MDQAEASGKTVEDALNRALARLGARREEVEFVVLDEGRKGGLFGRGARDAVVRVDRLAAPVGQPQDREPVDTRIPHGRQRPRDGRPPGEARPAGGGDRRPRGRGGRGGEGGRNGGGRRDQPRGRFETPAPKLTEQDFLRVPNYEEEIAEPPAGRETEPGRASGRPERERRRREEQPQIAPDINAEEVDYAAHVVDDLLRILDINAELTIREPLTAGDGLGAVRAVIDIRGEDLGLLIGRRGDTLLALQYIVNLIVTRRFPDEGGVTIDVEHYRHRREEQVVSLARRMADRVRQTRSPITLEPMSPAERRLVHLALADDPELMTNSVGEGESRKVVISPRR
jgi:spoIIIJ-associated protein